MDSILNFFTRHRVAPNALMFLVIMIGLVGLSRLQTQFIPDFEISVVRVSTVWSGADAESVQENITKPLEAPLLSQSYISSVSSTSSGSISTMTISLDESVDDLIEAKSKIEALLSQVSLPAEAEEPQLELLELPESLVEILIYGDTSGESLKALADRAEDGLNRAGLSQVSQSGVPEQAIEIRFDTSALISSGLTIPQVANQISSYNLDTPIGLSELSASTLQLNLSNQKLSPQEIARLPIRLSNGGLIALQEMAEVELVYSDAQARLFYQGVPAVRLTVNRASTEDSLELADKVLAWADSFEAELPQGISLWLFNENYRYVESRIDIILENGLGGMILVLTILLLFLNHRLAFWVAAGIPVSFLATFLFMDLNGLSINLISLFGFLIALGIIVDDAIVVAENAYANLEAGDDAQTAAFKAAKKMLPAVTASSITTVAAFLPLLLVGGPAGTFTKSVPLVVIMAILASLIECFLILPGHLSHSLAKRKKQPNPIRKRIDASVEFVKMRLFKPLVILAVHNRRSVYALSVVSLVLAFSLVASGRVAFVFFPAIDQPSVDIQMEFAEGTSEQRITSYLNEVEAEVEAANAEREVPFLKGIIQLRNNGNAQTAGLQLFLDDSTDRSFSNAEIVELIRQRVEVPVGLLDLRFVEAQQGPSSGGVQIRVSTENPSLLQAAVDELKAGLIADPRVIEVESNINSGAQALSIELRPDAVLNGLDILQVQSQVRAFTQAQEVQSLRVDDGELSINLIGTTEEQSFASLAALPIQVGERVVPLSSLADLRYESSVDALTRRDGRLSASVSAQTADDSINANELNAALQAGLLEELRGLYPSVDFNLGGDFESQADFLIDVQVGMVVGLVLIFGTLAWVFNSWTWPVAVMAIIPFGLTGAILGHWAMGLPLSALSIYGLFGLSGIVINDSIVLVSFYRDLRAKGMAVKEAVIEAAVQRFRAVILTSMTTVGGLSPLLLEKSFDAQFLLPMAAGLVFGLAFATLLILLLLPCLLSSLEERLEKRQLKRAAKQEAAMLSKEEAAHV
jgi:multidrug efflux pump subunit AcrB